MYLFLGFQTSFQGLYSKKFSKILIPTRALPWPFWATYNSTQMPSRIEWVAYYRISFSYHYKLNWNPWYYIDIFQIFFYWYFYSLLIFYLNSRELYGVLVTFHLPLAINNILLSLSLPNCIHLKISLNHFV